MPIRAFNAQTWAVWYQLQLWSNFTLFFNDEVNGDGIEQKRQALLERQQHQLSTQLQALGPADGNLRWFSKPLRSHPCGSVQSNRTRRAARDQQEQLRTSNQSGLVRAAGDQARPPGCAPNSGARMDNFWYDVKPNRRSGQHREPDLRQTVRQPSSIPSSILSSRRFNDTDVAKATNLFLNFGGGFHSNDARVFVQDPTKKSRVSGAVKWAAKTRLFDRLDMTLVLLALLPGKRARIRRRRGHLRARRGQPAAMVSRASFATIFCRG